MESAAQCSTKALRKLVASLPGQSTKNPNGHRYEENTSTVYLVSRYIFWTLETISVLLQLEKLDSDFCSLKLESNF